MRGAKIEAAELKFFERMNYVTCVFEVDLTEAKDFPGMACSPDAVCYLSIYDMCQGKY